MYTLRKTLLRTSACRVAKTLLRTSASRVAPDNKRDQSTAPPGPAQGSPVAPVAPVADAGGAAQRHPEADAHTLATELGGISMQEQIAAMEADAAQQERLVNLIARLAEQTVARNDSLGRSTALAAFEGEKASVIVGSYVRRIAKYGGCSACCFVAGLIYLNRLKRREPSVCLTSCNFQRLLLVAVMLGAKFLDDLHYSNELWAKVGGMTTAELNCLELEFLFRVGFSLTLTREEYDRYVAKLYKLMGSEQPAERPAVMPVLASAAGAEGMEANGMEVEGPKGEGLGEKSPSFTNVATAAMTFRAANPAAHAPGPKGVAEAGWV